MEVWGDRCVGSGRGYSQIPPGAIQGVYAHNPPHFHAIYGEYVGEFDIRTLDMIEGDLPNKAQSLIQEWGKMHQDDLMEIWNSQQFKKLKPLE